MSNEIQASMTSKNDSIVPVVGMGATVRIGTDRYPYTIVSISASGKTIVLQEDFYNRLDSNGLDEWQEYSYISNSNGDTITFRLGKNGYYKNNKRGLYACIGFRRAYIDPCF